MATKKTVAEQGLQQKMKVLAKLFDAGCKTEKDLKALTLPTILKIPDLTMPEQPELSMGRYARMRKKFLKEHHKVRYYNLLTSCALNEHLNDTERRANEMEQILTEQMAASEGVTESLKATDMMSWVRKMNSIRSRVQEIVMTEVIFA